MNLKLFSVLLCILQVIVVKCDCDSYFDCLSDFVQNFFVDNKNETFENIDVSNIPKDFVQIQDVTFREVNKILTDVSNILKSDLEKLREPNTVFRNVKNQTHIFVKTFDFNKENVKNYIQNKESNELVIDEHSMFSKQNLESNKKINVTENPKANEKIKLDNVFKKGTENVRDNEISDNDEFDEMYYDSREDNSTDYPIIDYVELYKDTTNEDIYIFTEIPTSTEVNLNEEILKQNEEIEGILEYSINLINNGSNDINLEYNCNGNASTSKISDVVYPWIVSIFIKNDTKDVQFSYYCDGALISDRAILTAANCVFTNVTLDPDNLLVILGKKSLQTMRESEKTQKIKQIITHENFTIENGKSDNNLAILEMEDAVTFSTSIQMACLNGEFGEYSSAATFAWEFNGHLEPIYFEKEKRECNIENKNENTFCATYGNAVALCPNYGGLYVTKQANNHWYLQGIRTGDPTVRGLCFDKTVHYTSLKNYLEWITDTLNVIKDDE